MKTIIVTGGHGFLGNCIVELAKEKYNVLAYKSTEHDLRSEEETRKMFSRASDASLLQSVNDGEEDVGIHAVIHAAATVGGIGATKMYPASFITENLQMGINVIKIGHVFGVNKIVLVGSVCEYPEYAPVPFNEKSIWEGYPEPTNAPYGISKKTLGEMLHSYYLQYGLKGARLILCNLYGPGDNFDPQSSHVIPAMIMKFHNAKINNDPSVTLWGTGRPSRDFLYVEDAAQAFVNAIEMVDKPIPINVGTGKETFIFWLAKKIKDLIGYQGEIVWDNTKPDGQKNRSVRTKRAEEYLGWKSTTSIEDGLAKTVAWYLERQKERG
jgi:nucleoside-diphosphate-sugar epimerase